MKGMYDIERKYQIGTMVFGNWIIKRRIGAGSFGEVFEIQREDFGQIYSAALKVITVPQSSDEFCAKITENGMSQKEVKQYFYSVVEDVVREFAIMSKFKGTANIVSYEDHDVIEHSDGQGWDILIRMELLTPLKTFALNNPFTRRDIIRLGIDMLKALELCQKYNVIHRDIKLENIFVSTNGDFKLGDFGIARTIEKTTSGMSKKGTYTYAIVQEIVSTDGATGEDLNNVQVESKSLLEKNASANMINIDDITFCGCKISSMDFSTLTSMDYISMMKDEGFSEENENVNSTELWTVKGWQDHDEKWGKYTGYGDASVSVERNSDVIRFSTNCSSTYYGEKQLSIGIKDIYIGSSFKEVLNGLGFENTAEFSERFHEVFSETKSIGDDAVEEKLDMMVHYNGDSFRIGNVWVEPDNWKLTLFVDNVDNADFYTLTFHFGAYGAAIRVYDDSIGKYRKWSEYQDCLTWFEITVFK